MVAARDELRGGDGHLGGSMNTETDVLPWKGCFVFGEARMENLDDDASAMKMLMFLWGKQIIHEQNDELSWV